MFKLFSPKKIGYFCCSKNTNFSGKRKGMLLLAGMIALISFGCAKNEEGAEFLDDSAAYKYSTHAVLKKNANGDYVLEGEIKELLTGSSKESAATSMGLYEFPMDQRTDENAQLWLIPALLIGDEVELSRQSPVFGFVSRNGPVLCKLPVEGKVKIEMPLDRFISQTEVLPAVLSKIGTVNGRLLLLGPSGKPLGECQSKSFVLKVDDDFKESQGK